MIFTLSFFSLDIICWSISNCNNRFLGMRSYVKILFIAVFLHPPRTWTGMVLLDHWYWAARPTFFPPFHL